MNRTDQMSAKSAGGSDKKTKPGKGGDSVQQAHEWGGGSKGSRGPITAEDRNNEQSSAKS